MRLIIADSYSTENKWTHQNTVHLQVFVCQSNDEAYSVSIQIQFCFFGFLFIFTIKKNVSLYLGSSNVISLLAGYWPNIVLLRNCVTKCNSYNCDFLSFSVATAATATTLLLFAFVPIHDNRWWCCCGYCYSGCRWCAMYMRCIWFCNCSQVILLRQLICFSLVHRVLRVNIAIYLNIVLCMKMFVITYVHIFLAYQHEI